MKLLSITLLLLGMFALVFLACSDKHKIAQRPVDLKTNTMNTKTSFFDFSVKSLDGQAVDLHQFEGKKIVVLNVASKCGYTPQYADWQAFYEKNQANTVVLGFPCNDFLSQEPGSAVEIGEFCQKNYGVTFPMFEKVHVKGSEKAPIYRWLTEPGQNGWNEQEPSWNFCKYLINEKGELTNFFASGVKPTDEAFLKALGQ